MTRWEPLEPLAPHAYITTIYLDDLLESHPDAETALRVICDLMPHRAVHDVAHLNMGFYRPIENTYGWTVRPFTMLELLVALERTPEDDREDYRRELLPLLEAQEWFAPDAVDLVEKLRAWEGENE